MKKTKKLVVKKPVNRVRKAKPVAVPEPGPFFRSHPKAQQEWTEKPTKAAIDATYGYLKRKGLIGEGSPVLKGLAGTKLEQIRKVL